MLAKSNFFFSPFWYLDVDDVDDVDDVGFEQILSSSCVMHVCTSADCEAL